MPNDLFADAAERKQPDTVERLFFGLMLPEAQAMEAVDVLERSRAQHGLRGNPIKPDRLHVTLIYIGDYPNALPPSIVSALSTAAESLAEPAFEIAFDRTSSFSGAPGRVPHVLLGGSGLDAVKTFRAKLMRAAVRHGVESLAHQTFTPHVTLSYADRPVPERSIKPISWRAEEFLLIHSEVGRPVYHTLGRWPLR